MLKHYISLIIIFIMAPNLASADIAISNIFFFSSSIQCEILDRMINSNQTTKDIIVILEKQKASLLSVANSSSENEAVKKAIFEKENQIKSFQAELDKDSDLTRNQANKLTGYVDAIISGKQASTVSARTELDKDGLGRVEIQPIDKLGEAAYKVRVIFFGTQLCQLTKYNDSGRRFDETKSILSGLFSTR